EVLKTRFFSRNPTSSLCGASVEPGEVVLGHGCALLRKKFEEDLHHLCVEMEVFKTLKILSNHPDGQFHVLNASSRANLCQSSDLRYDEFSIQTQEYLKKFSSTITLVLPIEEPNNSLSMGDEHFDTIPSIENLVPIPSEFEGIFDNTSDVPNCDNVESDLVESLINRDTLIVYSSKIDPILEEFVGELAHIVPIPPGIVGCISIDVSDNSNNTLLELPEFESFHFDPSFLHPPLEPPDVEICLHFEPDVPVINNFDEPFRFGTYNFEALMFGVIVPVSSASISFSFCH
ncbi:hypothetical protein Tco_0940418, partial [Tanacetum coccineum]